MSQNQQLPHWDMTNVYPGLDSLEFKADFDRLAGQIDDLEAFIEGPLQQAGPDSPADELAQAAGKLIDMLNETQLLSSTLRAYLTGFTAVDSFNTEARRLESQFQVQSARLG